MANREDFSERRKRQNRYFSESFKRAKVKDLEQNLVTIAEISREYKVTRNAIYKWLYKYSTKAKKGVKTVVETDSDTRKLLLLQAKIQELERIIGQKQIALDFKEKMIELAEEEYQIDIKKKFGSKPSFGSGSTEESTKKN